MTINGTAGDDVLHGGQADDIFDLTQGGNDRVSGRGGDDIFLFGGTFTAEDSVRGGSGHDVLALHGSYAAGVVFTAATMSGVEEIRLGDGHAYTLTLDDGNVAKGGRLIVSMTASNAFALHFNGSHESNGGFDIVAGSGNDILIGGDGDDVIADGAGNDEVHSRFGHDVMISGGGHDSYFGGGLGDNVVKMGAYLDAGDRISDVDTVELDGDYSAGLVLKGQMIDHVDTILLDAGHSYDLTAHNAISSILGRFVIDASALGENDSLRFDGHEETTEYFVIHGGAGDDVLTGSTGTGDVLYGGGGADQFVYTKWYQSTQFHLDNIVDFSHADGDRLDLHAIDADETKDGNQRFHLGGGSFTGTAGELIQVLSKDHVVVEGDIDGDGKVDFGVYVTGTQLLSADDIVL